jgi:hypothetical protein
MAIWNSLIEHLNAEVLLYCWLFFFSAALVVAVYIVWSALRIVTRLHKQNQTKPQSAGISRSSAHG